MGRAGMRTLGGGWCCWLRAAAGQTAAACGWRCRLQCWAGRTAGSASLKAQAVNPVRRRPLRRRCLAALVD